MAKKKNKETVKPMVRTKTSDVIFNSLKISIHSRVPVLFLSNPGGGKTTLVKLFAKVNGYEVTEINMTHGSVDDLLGYPVNTGKDYLEHLYPSWFKRILDDDKEGKKHILFLDEITAANDIIQAGLFKVIFDREVAGVKLPESCVIVAAGNYIGNLSRSFSLLSPTTNRFCVINLDTDISHQFASYINNEIDDVKTYVEKNPSILMTSASTLSPEVERQINTELTSVITRLIRLFGIENISKEDFEGTEDFYLDFNNKDFSILPTILTEVYGVMTGRSLSYLSKMTKSSIALDIPLMPEIALGLVGFGTLNYNPGVGDEILYSFHNHLASLYCSITELLATNTSMSAKFLSEEIEKSAKHYTSTYFRQLSEPEIKSCKAVEITSELAKKISDDCLSLSYQFNIPIDEVTSMVYEKLQEPFISLVNHSTSSIKGIESDVKKILSSYANDPAVTSLIEDVNNMRNVYKNLSNYFAKDNLTQAVAEFDSAVTNIVHIVTEARKK